MTTADTAAALHRRLLDEGGGLAELHRLVLDAVPLATPAERAELARLVEARLVGLGPVDQLTRDPTVSEVMINGPGPVWVERAGRIEPAGLTLDAEELALLIERIVAPTGRTIDPLRPWLDAQLADGSRVNVVDAPIAVDGPYVTIRRFALAHPSLDRFGPSELTHRLESLVGDGATLLVSGGTGAGKTTLLNGLAGAIPRSERVVTVEDVAELRLDHPHVVRLECRPAGTEGVGAVAMHDLVRTALRMRPDRLVLGEVRGPEAFDLLQAFNTGHDGGMATVHANSPHDALRRLASLVAAAGTGIPHGVVVDLIASAIDVVVQVARTADETRRVVAVAEVSGPETVRTVWERP